MQFRKGIGGRHSRFKKNFIGFIYNLPLNSFVIFAEDSREGEAGADQNKILGAALVKHTLHLISVGLESCALAPTRSAEYSINPRSRCGFGNGFSKAFDAGKDTKHTHQKRTWAVVAWYSGGERTRTQYAFERINALEVPGRR